MPGRNVTRSDLDHAMGEATAALNKAMLDLDNIRDNFLRGKSAADLVLLGYADEAEAQPIINAINDTDQLFKIYKGSQPLTVEKDFRDNIKKLWGLGV